MTPQKSDVLIIGGGFMGSSSAFFLRQHGRSVTLLERDQIGQYASASTSATCAVRAGFSANWSSPVAPGRSGSACPS
ncbi:FAD-dependent oxidoreductase [Pseudomonas syringae]|uniref:FAD-dependent oxidoreductase n=1 Tax=Pseudomonas syringae TaxID=317 RepID=UPI000A229045|nr:FAD-dependent oxidoreductase [Pseudomonas syringae]OSO26459.1 D-amino acid dehydrogenase [Pseudomonas syringae pv. actinidiae]